jgi:hypothetical protein
LDPWNNLPTAGAVGYRYVAGSAGCKMSKLQPPTQLALLRKTTAGTSTSLKAAVTKATILSGPAANSNPHPQGSSLGIVNTND